MLTECRELLQFMLSVFVSGLLNQLAIDISLVASERLSLAMYHSFAWLGDCKWPYACQSSVIACQSSVINVKSSDSESEITLTTPWRNIAP
jgi:hypothetical protein